MGVGMCMVQLVVPLIVLVEQMFAKYLGAIGKQRTMNNAKHKIVTLIQQSQTLRKSKWKLPETEKS